MKIVKRAKGCMEVRFGNFKRFEIRKNTDGWEIASWDWASSDWLFSSGKAPEGAFSTRKAALQALIGYCE